LRNFSLTALFILLALAAVGLLGYRSSSVVSAQAEMPGSIRVGERLTYNISLNRIPNVAFAETEVVSKGKIAGREAYEVRSKLKSINFMAVGSLFVDVDRTTYISPVDGSVLMMRQTDSTTGAPITEGVKFTEKSPGSFDLTALLFKIRSSGGVGSYPMFENGKLYTAAFQSIGTETVKSDAGEFPANIIEVRSDYLTENGFMGLKVSIASEGSNIPVQFRLRRTKNSEYVGVIASVQVAPDPTPSPTAAVAVRTPKPTPVATPTPAEYIDNQPLVGMPFALGEKLEYTITSSQGPGGTLLLEAKERRMVNKRDTLMLSATITNSAGGNDLFGVGNNIRSNVDPETLAPYDLTMGLSGRLSAFNQSAKFDQESGRVTVPGAANIDVPVGTHNIISLFYALRLFNLDPGKNSTNRVADTRVSVFWQGRPNIFTLRPSAPQILPFGDQKILAQEISVSTGNPQLDSLRIRVWLTDDERRLPLRFVLDGYQFDLKREVPSAEP
jgi:hypothetical protein